MTLIATADLSLSNNRLEKLYRHYAALEKLVKVDERSTKTTYRSPVNFIESMQCARHRWFPYKEGFSPSFVRNFLHEFDIEPNGIVLDPFSGSGTTSLVAGEMGRKSIGMDVSPLTTSIAAAKATTLDAHEQRLLREHIEIFRTSDLTAEHLAPDNDTVKSYYHPAYLSAILRIKGHFTAIENDKVRSLFKLAFLASIEPFSTHRKAGNGVKRKSSFVLSTDKTDALENCRSFMLERLEVMLIDIQGTKHLTIPEFWEASSLDASQHDKLDPISSLLTSPPYANCFDYSKIYMSELWLGDFFKCKEDQKAFREKSVRSHVHAHWNDRHLSFGSSMVEDIIREHIDQQQLWSPRIGSMLSGYFQDLGMLLAQIKPRVVPGGTLGFVVGNSFYGGLAVATDLLLAELALQHGYEVISIQVYRGVIPSSQQYKLLGENRKYMRESLVLIRNR
jgi:hypothetical protein